MSLGEVPIGTLVLAKETVSAESTSSLYGGGEVARPDPALFSHARDVLEERGEPYRVGAVASLDGFYTDLVALRPELAERVAARSAALRERGVIATDMESSAVLAVGNALDMRAGSLCLCSVDGPSRDRMPLEPRRDAERRLVTTSLEIVSTFT
jgi:uridine phosphorylase